MTAILKRATLALAAAALLAAASGAARAATTVDVSLWDKGADVEMASWLAYGAPNADMSKATMGIKASPDTAKAGVVTFKVTNDSKDTIHEMIVMYLADPGAAAALRRGEKRVDEDKAGDKGEVSELDPGAVGVADGQSPAGQVSADLQRGGPLRRRHVDQVHRHQVAEPSAGAAVRSPAPPRLSVALTRNVKVSVSVAIRTAGNIAVKRYMGCP